MMKIGKNHSIRYVYNILISKSHYKFYPNFPLHSRFCWIYISFTWHSILNHWGDIFGFLLYLGTPSVRDDAVFLKEMHSEAYFIGILGNGLFRVFHLICNILIAISKSTVLCDQCLTFTQKIWSNCKSTGTVILQAAKSISSDFVLSNVLVFQ